MSNRKFTRRKSGLLMCTVQIKFHMDRDYLIYAAYRNGFMDIKSRSELMNEAVTCLQNYGMDYNYEFEDEQAREKAELLVDRLFPELKPTETPA